MVKFFSSTKGFSPLERASPAASSHRRSRSGGGGAGSNPAGGTAKPQVTGLPAASSPASVRGQSANSPQDLQLPVATHGPNNYVITSKIERRANAGGCYVRGKKAAYGGHPLLEQVSEYLSAVGRDPRRIRAYTCCETTSNSHHWGGAAGRRSRSPLGRATDRWSREQDEEHHWRRNPRSSSSSGWRTRVPVHRLRPRPTTVRHWNGSGTVSTPCHQRGSNHPAATPNRPACAIRTRPDPAVDAPARRSIEGQGANKFRAHRSGPANTCEVSSGVGIGGSSFRP